MQKSEIFGSAHHKTACIFEFSERLSDKDEREMLETVSAQLEASCFSLALGLYRQAFTSLRLAFEMGMGVAYFSINKLEHQEWIGGKGDIKWSKLIDNEIGVLSARVTVAFFPELIEETKEYKIRASDVYRKISEYVHGNKETWTKSGIKLQINESLTEQFFNDFHEVFEILLFVLSCRYLKSISGENLEGLEFIQHQLNHLSPIRTLFGGPKE